MGLFLLKLRSCQKEHYEETNNNTISEEIRGLDRTTRALERSKKHNPALGMRGDTPDCVVCVNHGSGNQTALPDTADAVSEI